MFPYLRVMIVHLWIACIACVVVSTGLVMGYFSVYTFLWAGILAVVIGVPAGLLNWIYLRPNRSAQMGWTWPIARWARNGFGVLTPRDDLLPTHMAEAARHVSHS